MRALVGVAFGLGLCVACGGPGDPVPESLRGAWQASDGKVLDVGVAQVGPFKGKFSGSASGDTFTFRPVTLQGPDGAVRCGGFLRLSQADLEVDLDLPCAEVNGRWTRATAPKEK